ncbi:MAG: hypothetical protein E7636_02810 [Ruminococcaceae bacterium]|nr:hypothetical protein [Oscillospiraceae bacterium]
MARVWRLLPAKATQNEKKKIPFFVIVGRKMPEKGKMRSKVGRKALQKRNISKNGKAWVFSPGGVRSLWKTLWKLCKTPFVARLSGFFCL